MLQPMSYYKFRQILTRLYSNDFKTNKFIETKIFQLIEKYHSISEIKTLPDMEYPAMIITLSDEKYIINDAQNILSSIDRIACNYIRENYYNELDKTYDDFKDLSATTFIGNPDWETSPIPIIDGTTVGNIINISF